MKYANLHSIYSNAQFTPVQLVLIGKFSATARWR